MGQAAEASRAIATRTTELSGKFASAHAELLDATAQRLERATAADARLADHLGAASQTHGEGGAQAAELRAGAADVPARLAPWEQYPAGELAALKALRHQVAGMQQWSPITARRRPVWPVISAPWATGSRKLCTTLSEAAARMPVCEHGWR